ncbi:RNA polymerase sigma factor SigJ [Ensifer adhaerens]|uniref:RNA polymerase sigma factor SigJ n=1 Tax=Ensifer adhaerens TaxID=106592 RepID=A0A0L8BQJ7_ENSAD|nr:sigma-70 family RNA polymerase sigma factor [Ensifer adhaerens]KOF16789.1 RNA polymerase sigma factor SigJ [Ensifer adhaerens]
MAEMTDEDVRTTFDPLRPRLIRIAYRMLGSVSEAEDIVQEAFLRWLDADRVAVKEPSAFLRRIVTRLCLDQLKSARRRRETYLGPWLPEPVIEQSDDLDDITLPLMMALERLSPLERAAFLLHDVFGLSFDEIGETISRKPATCRQLASRARVNIRSARRRFVMPREQGLEIASAFFVASRSGDMQQLRSLLATEAIVYADGGGKTVAPRRPIAGLDQVMKLHASLALIFAETMSRLVRYDFINGLPGFITIEDGEILQTTALQIEQDRITAIYVTRNPEKLKHLPETLKHLHSHVFH